MPELTCNWPETTPVKERSCSVRVSSLGRRFNKKPNHLHQHVTRSRVCFNHTQQDWCEHDLSGFWPKSDLHCLAASELPSQDIGHATQCTVVSNLPVYYSLPLSWMSLTSDATSVLSFIWINVLIYSGYVKAISLLLFQTRCLTYRDDRLMENKKHRKHQVKQTTNIE